jgi:hypothetical protein
MHKKQGLLKARPCFLNISEQSNTAKSRTGESNTEKVYLKKA